jgi:FtsP/CotA-like multicopper oxidase with cupredoxin domain
MMYDDFSCTMNSKSGNLQESWRQRCITHIHIHGHLVPVETSMKGMQRVLLEERMQGVHILWSISPLCNICIIIWYASHVQQKRGGRGGVRGFTMMMIVDDCAKQKNMRAKKWRLTKE